MLTSISSKLILILREQKRNVIKISIKSGKAFDKIPYPFPIDEIRKSSEYRKYLS